MIELQKEAISIIRERCRKKQITLTSKILLIHLLEELGEIARQFMNERLKMGLVNKKNLAEEIADCPIILFGLADINDIDTEQALKQKLKEVKNKE